MIVAFKPEHLRALILQDAQAWMQPMMTAGYAEQLREEGPCHTLLIGSHIVACAGMTMIWEGRAQAWALVSFAAGAHMVRLVKAIRRFLDAQQVRRIETTVDANFEAGHRMVKMLGFEPEGLMRAYLPDGRDCFRYVRFCNGRS